MTRLGQLERRVMDVLWGSMGTELTVRQVAEELPTHAYTTIMTVLDRLYRKHMVSRSKDGRAHLFAAAATREAYTAELMHEALGAAGDRDAVLVRFAETVSPAEAQVLRRALGQPRADPGGRAGVATRRTALTLYAEAAALALMAVMCLGPMSVWLDRAPWAVRAPRAAVLLWQSLGLAGSLSAIGAGLAVAVVRFRMGLLPGTLELVDKVFEGHPLTGLGLPDALGLTFAADVAIVLTAVMTIMAWRTVRTRARHRRVLDLVTAGGRRADGAILLDHPRATAYCLPGLRPRIVVSKGAVDLLRSAELAAVVDHERGHVHEHHGLVMLSLTSFTEPIRWIPYARRAPRAVATLLEMAADDFAARHRDPRVLARALVQMGEPGVAPRFAFCAASTAVPARVARLLDDARTSRTTAFLAGTCALGLVALPLLAFRF